LDLTQVGQFHLTCDLPVAVEYPQRQVYQHYSNLAAQALDVQAEHQGLPLFQTVRLQDGPWACLAWQLVQGPNSHSVQSLGA
jgi:hypothetical protein